MFSLFPSTLVSGPESVNRVTRRCKRRQGGRLRRTAIQATIALAAAGLALLTMLVTLAALAVPAMAATASLQVAGPRFETGPCPFPPGVIPPGVRVDCGNLIVPGDRARADSSSVSLAVAIIRSPNPAPAPDPILFLADGPGGGGLDWLTYFVTSAPDLRADRDIILLDQRGTGYSQPSLRCFEFDSLERAARARQLSLAQTQDLDLQTAAACHDRLAAAGVQLSAYTTGAAAADIKDLRLALGYLEWNLYGLGYGSRLALTVLRDYPDGVRSVVLDSAQPPQVAGWETAAANANRAFNALFVACGLQPACNAAYPGLGLKFAEAVDRLKATPVSVQVLDPLTGSPSPVLFTGQTLIAGVARALADGRQGLVPYLPLAITQLDAGSAAMAEGFATSLSAGPDLMHSGLWYSVQCHDEAPLNDRARIQADANAFPRFRDFILSDTTLAICPGWGAGQADSKESRPVRSDVPALVLAGEYDPLQPPVWSQLAASTLQHSIYYLLPGVGHGASLQGCGQVLVVQFMADPNLAPKPVCVSGAQAPTFVSDTYVNPGIHRLAAGLVLRFDLTQALPFLACGALFASALLVWPLAALFQRQGRDRRRAGFARWLATLTVLLDLLFAAALVVLIVLTNQQQPGLLLFGLPPETAPLFAVPWVAMVLTAGLLWLTVLAWKDGYWSLAGRVHYTLVVAAAAGFIWLLYRWSLLGLS